MNVRVKVGACVLVSVARAAAGVVGVDAGVAVLGASGEQVAEGVGDAAGVGDPATGAAICTGVKLGDTHAASTATQRINVPKPWRWRNPCIT